MIIKKGNSPLYRSLLIAICLALMTYSVALAASGGLDTSFSGDGKIIQSFGGSQHVGWNVAIQSDGKIVVVGDKWLSNGGRDFAIARYNTNGTLDTTFNGNGRQVVSIGVLDQALSVAIQSDGKIVVGGQTCSADGAVCDVALVRLKTNGKLDTSFSGDGKVTTDIGSADNGGFDLTLQGSKIVVAGYMYDGSSYNATVYRYNANGSLDSTFNGDGILPIDFGQDDFFHGVIVNSGKIYVVGNSGPSDGSTSDFIAARINSNGTPDTTFSADGKVKTDLGGYDQANDLVISSGKVIVVGYSSTKLAIVQYTASGALDTTFSGDGKLTANLGFPSPIINGVAIQGGKIIVAGRTDRSSRFTGDGLLVRYTATGNLDTTFGHGGIVSTNWGGGDSYRSVVFKNSRIYVVGTSTTASDLRRFIIASYLP